MIRHILCIITLCMTGLTLTSAPAQAATPSEITARMKERLAEIDSLKLAEKLGENNNGLLEPRGSLAGDERKLVQAQNEDREALYEYIANQNNTSVSVVAKQRAVQIAKQSKPGIWLQKPNGEWYKK